MKFHIAIDSTWVTSGKHSDPTLLFWSEDSVFPAIMGEVSLPPLHLGMEKGGLGLGIVSDQGNLASFFLNMAFA